VFYLTDPLTVCAGEDIQGSITCHPNDRNPRDLDIIIKHDFKGKFMQSANEQAYKLR
jgi:protein arginine N-methyltransferase 1